MYDSYTKAIDALIKKGYTYTPDDEVTEENIQRNLIELNEYMSKIIRSEVRNKPDPRYPDGSWHMLTITSKVGAPRDVVINDHLILMAYLHDHNIQVYIATLEKSSMYHIHYAIRAPQNLKNEKPQIKRLLPGRILKIEEKVNCFQRWQGLFKYVLKRNYPKDTTAVETLYSRVTYEEGKGYILHEKNII